MDGNLHSHSPHLTRWIQNRESRVSNRALLRSRLATAQSMWCLSATMCRQPSSATRLCMHACTCFHGPCMYVLVSQTHMVLALLKSMLIMGLRTLQMSVDACLSFMLLHRWKT